MINDDYSEFLEKNRVLDNSSNKFVQINFDKITSDKKINLDIDDYIKYGYIYISVKSAENFQLYYKDLLLLQTSEATNIFIPCIFENEPYLQLKGTCEDLKMCVYGVRIQERNNFYLIPSLSCVVKDRGKLALLKYTSIDDIKNNNYSSEVVYESAIDIQNYKDNSGNQNLIQLKRSNDNVYLCGTINNVSGERLVDSGIEDAKIAINYIVPYEIYVVYIKNANLYFKRLNDSSDGFGVARQINLVNDYTPLSLSDIQMETNANLGLFGVNLSDGNVIIYSINADSCKYITSKRGDFSRVMVGTSKFEVITMQGNMSSIRKYTNSNGRYIQENSDIDVYNAIDILKVGDKYLVYSFGDCAEVKYDSD